MWIILAEQLLIVSEACFLLASLFQVRPVLVKIFHKRKKQSARGCPSLSERQTQGSNASLVPGQALKALPTSRNCGNGGGTLPAHSTYLPCKFELNNIKSSFI
jgi:hypothetical protein